MLSRQSYSWIKKNRFVPVGAPVQGLLLKFAASNMLYCLLFDCGCLGSEWSVIYMLWGALGFGLYSVLGSALYACRVRLY